MGGETMSELIAPRSETGACDAHSMGIDIPTVRIVTWSVNFVCPKVVHPLLLGIISMSIFLLPFLFYLFEGESMLRLIVTGVLAS